MTSVNLWEIDDPLAYVMAQKRGEHEARQLAELYADLDLAEEVSAYECCGCQECCRMLEELYHREKEKS